MEREVFNNITAERLAEKLVKAIETLDQIRRMIEAHKDVLPLCLHPADDLAVKRALESMGIHPHDADPTLYRVCLLIHMIQSSK